MKLVSIDTALFNKYKDDPEVLTKSKRPYVLVIRLKYKETNYDFAVPIRSNIPAATPKGIIHNSQQILITFSLNFSLTISFHFTGFHCASVIQNGFDITVLILSAGISSCPGKAPS